MDYLVVNGLPKMLEEQKATLSKVLMAKATAEQAETIRQSLDSTVSWSAVEGDFVALVQSIYTTEELNAMIAFARSAVGRGMAGKDQRFFSAAMKVAQKQSQLLAGMLPPPAKADPLATVANMVGVSKHARLAYIVPPVLSYPPESRAKGEKGVVHLRVLVSAQGEAEAVGVVQSSGYPRLDEAALAALARAKFRPYMENGVPTAVYAPATLTFELED